MTRGVVASDVPSSNSMPDFLHSTRTAVILVAGVGARLRPLTDDRPKALMDLGGETILGRALRLLRSAGVDDIVLATGYREDQIRAALAEQAIFATIIANPQYDTSQNSVSLACCCDALLGKSFFKLDGDVVFQPAVLDRLQRSSAPLAVAVDAERGLDEEAMKVQVERGKITRFGKGIALSEAAAETIGIERLSVEAGARVFAAIQRGIAAGRRDRYYEDYYSDLVAAGELEAEAVQVGDLPWSEVDTFEDLERARRSL
jgi:choline kinase